LGGLIAFRALIKKTDLPIHSLILSAPLLGMRIPMFSLKTITLPLLSKIWGSFHLNHPFNASHLSHDPNILMTYEKDRLVHQKVTKLRREAP